MGTSKNSQRHPELVSGSLVSASPRFQEIDCVELRFAPVAGHARNDGSVTNGVLEVPLYPIPKIKPKSRKPLLKTIQTISNFPGISKSTV